MGELRCPTHGVRAEPLWMGTGPAIPYCDAEDCVERLPMPGESGPRIALVVLGALVGAGDVATCVVIRMVGWSAADGQRRVGFYLGQLREAGLVESPRRGYWRATVKGERASSDGRVEREEPQPWRGVVRMSRDRRD
jgi:DNA-binding transcriptional ArsR family regulator